ncbi:iron chelate uptake ABC transporter family permease subunit [Actinobaculum sp. 352]|uniref:FecCD family ABC transporter permease n=1 Tax=Actinobaculum sp. 352 TaxID=2490946 RepID=UPI001F49FA2C|nr:iron chelate uptake ABC transporter family permease subunit [Actinobaculum sp. 352]
MLLLAAVAIGCVTLTTGSYDIPMARIIEILRGGQEGTDAYLVLNQRLPRVVAALLIGICLAASGVIFQTLSSNALGSPDLIGFTTGATTGGLVVIIVMGRSTGNVLMLGAFCGGLATATAVLLVARAGAGTGERLVVAGIAIAAMLSSVNDYLVSRADIETAEAARVWQHGSLNVITWRSVVPLALGAAVGIPLAMGAGRVLRYLELGDDVAIGVGLPLRRVQIGLAVLGVGLAAVAVASGGPIGFVALAAPQLARRLARSPGAAMVPAMAMGAALLVCSDLIAQRALSPFQIPVGLVTGAIGGLYLVAMLLRRRSA